MLASDIPLVPSDELTNRVAEELAKKYGRRFHRVDTPTFAANLDTGALSKGYEPFTVASVATQATLPGETIVEAISKRMQDPDLHVYLYSASETVADCPDRPMPDPNVFEVEGCVDPRTLEPIPGTRKVRVIQLVRYAVVPIIGQPQYAVSSGNGQTVTTTLSGHGPHAYRKKPVVIEAFQMTAERRQRQTDWPDWLREAFNKNHTEVGSVQTDGPTEMVIQTLEGEMTVRQDDFIIRGVNGELYPCKPDIFAKTYEKA